MTINKICELCTEFSVYDKCDMEDGCPLIKLETENKKLKKKNKELRKKVKELEEYETKQSWIDNPERMGR